MNYYPIGGLSQSRVRMVFMNRFNTLLALDKSVVSSRTISLFFILSTLFVFLFSLFFSFVCQMCQCGYSMLTR